MPELLYLVTETLEFGDKLDLVDLTLGVEVPVVLINDRDVGLRHDSAQGCGCSAAKETASQRMGATSSQAPLQASSHGRGIASNRNVTLKSRFSI